MERPKVLTVGQLRDVISALPDEMPVAILEIRYMGYDDEYEDVVIASVSDSALYLTPSVNGGILTGLEILDPKDWKVT